MSTPFTVDGSTPTGFEVGDTRHAVQPGGLTARRVESFPGSGTKFVVLGAARPPVLTVSGRLRAASYAELYATIEQYNADAAESRVVSVRFHSRTYPACAFMGIQVSGRPIAFTDDGGQTVKVMQQAQLLFEVLESR